MKEMLGYQMDEVAASLKMSLSFDPTTLIEIAVYSISQQSSDPLARRTLGTRSRSSQQRFEQQRWLLGVFSSRVWGYCHRHSPILTKINE